MNVDVSDKKDIEKNNSFADGYNLYKYFWVYYFGGFFGVIFEMVLTYIRTGLIQSRTALILEPLNPVYGIGAVLVTLAFSKLKRTDWFTVLIISMVMLGTFEWLMSFAQEKVFGSISWYYTDTELGIYGRTSILLSFYWGVLALLWFEIGYPFISKMVEKIPNKFGKALTIALLTLTIIDALYSTMALRRHFERMNGVPASNFVQSFFDKKFNDDIINKIYPNMMFLK